MNLVILKREGEHAYEAENNMRLGGDWICPIPWGLRKPYGETVVQRHANRGNPSTYPAPNTDANAHADPNSDPLAYGAQVH